MREAKRYGDGVWKGNYYGDIDGVKADFNPNNIGEIKAIDLEDLE